VVYHLVVAFGLMTAQLRRGSLAEITVVDLASECLDPGDSLLEILRGVPTALLPGHARR